MSCIHSFKLPYHLQRKLLLPTECICRYPSGNEDIRVLLAQRDAEQGSRQLALHFGRCFTVFPQSWSQMDLTCTSLERKLMQSSAEVNSNVQTESLDQYCKVHHCNLWQSLCSSKVAQEKLGLFATCFKVLSQDSLHEDETELHSGKALVLRKQTSTPAVIATWAIQTQYYWQKLQ